MRTLTLPRWARCRWVILHELAHPLTPGEIRGGHPSRFCGNYIELVRAHMDREYATALQDAFEAHNVDWEFAPSAVAAAPPVPVASPVPKRSPVATYAREARLHLARLQAGGSFARQSLGRALRKLREVAAPGQWADLVEELGLGIAETHLLMRRAGDERPEAVGDGTAPRRALGPESSGTSPDALASI